MKAGARSTGQDTGVGGSEKSPRIRSPMPMTRAQARKSAQPRTHCSATARKTMESGLKKIIRERRLVSARRIMALSWRLREKSSIPAAPWAHMADPRRTAKARNMDGCGIWRRVAAARVKARRPLGGTYAPAGKRSSQRSSKKIPMGMTEASAVAAPQSRAAAIGRCRSEVSIQKRERLRRAKKKR